MPKKKRFLVIGLGVLGNSIALNLAESGAEVIVLDQDQELLEQIRDQVDVAIFGDATDRKMLEQIGAPSVDAAVVCIGENFEGAILATAHLLDLQVKHVAVRAHSELAASIMKRLGAHEVFFVEHAMGKVVAHRLAHRGVTHEMDLGEGYRIVQLKAPKEMWGRKLHDLALPKRFNVQVIALRSQKETGGMRNPAADTVIENFDTLLVSGRDEDLTRFCESWKE